MQPGPGIGKALKAWVSENRLTVAVPGIFVQPDAATLSIAATLVPKKGVITAGFGRPSTGHGEGGHGLLHGYRNVNMRKEDA
jgi:hypothetical protein